MNADSQLIVGFVADVCNPRDAASALGWPSSATVRQLNQVHGKRCVRLDGPSASALSEAPTADAGYTLSRGEAVIVRTADCVPVLLAWDGGVACVHAGWRGCATEVVPRSVEALLAEGIDPGAIRAWIGPAACGACYEVGPEVVEALEIVAPSGLLVREGSGDRKFVDLRPFVRDQLIASGVGEHAIEGHPDCTIHDHAWPSWRRQGASAGRLFGVIGYLP